MFYKVSIGCFQTKLQQDFQLSFQNLFSYQFIFYLSVHVHPLSELTEFKQRRIAYFKKNLVDLAELELKHSKVCEKLDLA